jgi:Spy/CpxP family protein refolding chaperone
LTRHAHLPTVARTTLLLPALLLFCCAMTATAQRGPGGGGPPGGGGFGGPPPGGGMGGNLGAPRNSFDRDPSPLNHAPPPRTGLQLGPPGRWWDDHKLVQRLGLRSDQQHRMDDIFNANKGTLLNLFSNLQREEQRLSSLPPGDLQDEGKVFAAIDRVATARAELEKENAHILMQIRQQMDPQQLSALDSEIAANR